MRSVSSLSFLLVLVGTFVAADQALVNELRQNMPGFDAAWAAAGNPEIPTRVEHMPEYHDYQKRAAGWQCTCKGFQFQTTTMYNQAWIDILHYQTSVKNPDGVQGTNPNGWCYQDAVMSPQWTNEIIDAFNTGTNNAVVNGTWLRLWCEDATACKTTGGCTTGAGCAEQLTLQHYSLIATINGWAACTWPTVNFIPLDCLCNFECTNGYVACGRNCIDPATQVCVSGVPAAQPARRQLDPNPLRRTFCEDGRELCPVQRGGTECIDTNSNLEACGGCPYLADGTPGNGVDCSDLPGANSVGCVSGQCKIYSCDSRHDLLNGECVPRANGRRRF